MKILLLLLFMFKVYAACEPGAVPCEEAGISNFKVQTVDPTFTASPGEKGLFNTNSQFKTKDELGNVQRLVQDPDNLFSLSNGDIEEGLTGFVFTAGTTIIETVQPLRGFKSIRFDSTAINDFAETALITIPIGLMGRTCMIKVDVKGADANLRLALINGAGTEIGFKQLTAFTDSTSQFVTFQCPAKALIDVTPALGQFKIKVYQSTASNAALATLDNFYLGQFESNQMVVSEVPQTYFYRADVDINGAFTFPAPLSSTGNGLFSYGASTLTALKPIIISINGWARTALVSNLSITSSIICTVSGVNRTISAGDISAGSTSGAAGGGTAPTISGVLNLNPGDTCFISFGRSAGALITNYVVNITATPLPQLATIVSTNQMRAGFYGESGVNCTTYNTITGTPAGAEFTATGCVTQYSEGFGVAPPAGNQTYFGLKLSTVPKTKGIYLKVANLRVTLTGDAFISWYNFSDSVALGDGIVLRTSDTEWTTFGRMNIPTTTTNLDLRLRCRSPGGAGTCILNNFGFFVATAFYEPDLSDPYSIPEVFAFYEKDGSLFKTTPFTAANRIPLSNAAGSREVNEGPSIPPAACGAGQFLQASGTGYVCSAWYIPYVVAASGQVLTSDGTNYGGAYRVNSSGGKWRTESCQINNNGTVTASCSTWISALTRTSAGLIRIDFNGAIWSSAPICTCTGHNIYPCNIWTAPTTTQFTTYSWNRNTTSDADTNIYINCQGPSL